MAYATYDQLKGGTGKKSSTKSTTATYDLLKKNIKPETIAQTKSVLEEGDKEREKKRLRDEVIQRSQEEAARYSAEAEKYTNRANTLEGIGKSFVRPFVSLAEVPKNIYGAATGKETTFGDVNVPGLGPVQSFQEEARKVTDEIVDGTKPLYSILKPMGSAVIDTAGLGLGSSVAKGVTKEAFKTTATRLAKEGSAYGFGQGAVDSIGDQQSYEEKAKNIALSTGAGALGAAGLGIGFNVIGRAFSALGQKVSGRGVKLVDEKEAGEAIQEITGIVNRDLNPDEENAVLDMFSQGATKDEIVTEVGKAKVAEGLEPKPRLADEVARIEDTGVKLNIEEMQAINEGLKSGKTAEESLNELRASKSADVSVEKPVSDTPTPEKPVSPEDGGDLLSEANKYKSAEEFVKSQTTHYHGTNESFNSFDSRIASTKGDHGSGMWGNGTYISDTGTAKNYGKNIIPVHADIKNSLDLTRFRSVKEAADFLGMSEDALTMTNGVVRPVSSQAGQFSSHVKYLGFDSIRVKTGPKSVETVVFDDAKLKTPSQLTDIWNKANKEKSILEDSAPKSIVGDENAAGRKEPKRKTSIIAERLNKDLPEDFKIDDQYDPKVINSEADKAAKLISEDKAKAIKKAIDTNTNPIERDAILIELSEIAKRDGDFSTLSDLFSRRSELIRAGAQSLNMEKASILLNPQEKYMRDIVNAKLSKVKVNGKELTDAELVLKRKSISKEASDTVKKAFKVEDAQALFDSLICK